VEKARRPDAGALLGGRDLLAGIRGNQSKNNLLMQWKWLCANALVPTEFSRLWTAPRWREIKKGFTHFANGGCGVAKYALFFRIEKSVVFSNF
jgi:hypothetical protein